MTITKTDLWFYRHKDTFHSDVIRACSGGSFTHVCVCVQGCVYNFSKGLTSGWLLHDTIDPPDIVVRIHHDPYPTLLTECLPVSQRYRKWRVILWWCSFGLFPEPYTCVSTARRALLLAGVKTKGKTPNELLEEVLRIPNTKVSCRPWDC